MNLIFEGNIGAGKTTLLNLVEKQLKCQLKDDIEVYPEPISFWEKTPDGNLLDLFGSNPSKYSFVLQTLIMSTMLKVRQSANARKVNLFERSLDSAKFIFQKLLEIEGYLSNTDTYALKILYDALKPNMPKIDGIVYL